MVWLNALTTQFCKLREENSDLVLNKKNNFFKRTILGKVMRLSAYEEIAKVDFDKSKELLDLVKSSTANIDSKEIKRGICSLKTHISTLESRSSYLVIYASLLAALFTVSDWAFSKTIMAGLLAIATFLALTDRIFISNRVYILKDLIEYLSIEVAERE